MGEHSRGIKGLGPVDGTLMHRHCWRDSDVSRLKLQRLGEPGAGLHRLGAPAPRRAPFTLRAASRRCVSADVTTNNTASVSHSPRDATHHASDVHDGERSELRRGDATWSELSAERAWRTPCAPNRIRVLISWGIEFGGIWTFVEREARIEPGELRRGASLGASRLSYSGPRRYVRRGSRSRASDQSRSK